MRKLAQTISALAISFALIAGAVRGQEVDPVMTPPESAVGPGLCSLLKHDQIETLIGTSIVREKSSQSFNGNLRVTQCVYVTEPADKSVSVVSTQRDPSRPGTQTAADFWRKAFGHALRDEDEKAERGKKEEEEKEGRPPKLVTGIGEQAFWTAGSLYVLRGEVLLRISIGGSTPEEARLEQSKKLARLLLARLT
jgi:hypothetical protein